MEIAGRTLGPGHPALVIVEIGNNHDGTHVATFEESRWVSPAVRVTDRVSP